MSEATEFLNEIESSLSDKLEEVNRTIEDVDEDIRSMNDYYWQSYTEMDEYGYEDYDNSRELERQEEANEDNRKYRQRLIKMIDSPFFGSVTFHFDDDDEEDEPQKFYIGIGNFSERPGALPLIYDWRAPVSSLFYDFEQGPASYEAPAGTITGEITSRAQYKIRGASMVYEFENDIKIDDEILQEELGKNADNRLKSIVRTIQKEQNAVIRDTKDPVLIIQGAAGSGKTSIALHRVAYLMYHDRKTLNASNILILSPNSVFSDYISQILPELGEENIREMNLDIFAYRELRPFIYDCEDRYDETERLIRLQKRSRSSFRKECDLLRYRNSRQFTEDMEEFLLGLEDEIVDIHDITYKKMTMKEEEIRTLFYERFADIPMLSRMDAVMERFVDEYETLYGDLSEDAAAEVKALFDNLIVTTDLYRIYNWFLRSRDLPELPNLEPDKRMLLYRDVYPMLYLKYCLWTIPPHSQVRHLVVDEMQDYTYLQYVILQMLFPCDKTILGDKAQSVGGEQDVTRFLPGILGKKTRVLELDKSYRNTSEISAYADSIRPVGDVKYFERHGKPVEEIDADFDDEDQICADILSRLDLSPTGYETAAVLAFTEDEAGKIYDILSARRDDVFYINRDSSNFQKGLTVTTWYMAKGLEFDQVFVMPVDEKLPFARQYRYITATRALHELTVYRELES